MTRPLEGGGLADRLASSSPRFGTVNFENPAPGVLTRGARGSVGGC